MFRIIAISCLVLSALAGPIESEDLIQPRTSASGGIQNFSAGKRVAGDKLIWSGSGHQMFDFARQITTEVPFPQDQTQPGNAVITQIVATTALDAGNTVYTISSGGIGQKNVMLRITSNNAHKVSYKIEIYGK